MRKAVFPGSFDPFTKGHEDIVNRVTDLFDEVIIAFGVNESKHYFFDTHSRIGHVKSIYKDNPKIKIIQYEGLTVDLCKELNADFIVRGLRNSIDLEYEKAIAEMNKSMKEIETIFLISSPDKAAISSSIIREIYKNGANIAPYVTNHEVLVISLK